MGSKYTSGFTHCKKTSKDIKITPVLRSCHWAKGDWLTLNCLFNLKQKPFIYNFWNCLAKGALRIQDLYLNWHVSWFNNHTILLYKVSGSQATYASSKMQITKNTDKLQCHYYEKLKWGLLMPLQWFVLFCKKNKYMH